MAGKVVTEQTHSEVYSSINFLENYLEYCEKTLKCSYTLRKKITPGNYNKKKQPFIDKERYSLQDYLRGEKKPKQPKYSMAENSLSLSLSIAYTYIIVIYVNMVMYTMMEQHTSTEVLKTNDMEESTQHTITEKNKPLNSIFKILSTNYRRDVMLMYYILLNQIPSQTP